MKSVRAILAVLLLAVLACVFSTPAKAEVSFGFFYSSLEPHGAWHVSAQYGQVWQPAIYAPGWNPYYDGHWLYTDVGWTWVSDYRWGAIPYHYGTWVVDPVLGWVWVPGYTWAPAWVTFRTGPDYIGWAPVAPSFALGVSFGAAVPASGAFVFVPTRAFLAPRVRGVAVPVSRRAVVFRETTVVRNPTVRNNVVVNRGPDVRVVERASGRPVRTVGVESVARVAPFTRVTRSRLEVDPQVARRGVRATERQGPKRVAPTSRVEPRRSQLPSTREYAQLREPHSPGMRRPSNERVPPRQARPKRTGPNNH